MKDRSPHLSTWIVTEGMAGTENQCLGVADALGVTPRILKIRLREPWRSLTPWLPFECATTFLQTGDVPAPPWPDLVIASGRKAVAACAYIRWQTPATRLVFLQNPRRRHALFDLIAAPVHDGLSGPNVIQTLGAANRITPDRLQQAVVARPDLAGRIRRPRVAVLIGGAHPRMKLDLTTEKAFFEKLRALAATHGLMVTPSRRTGMQTLSRLRHALAGTDALIWDGAGENPYFAFLAFADYILVTGDSVSMISDAATSGKPVYVQPVPGAAGRFAPFYDALGASGAMRFFEGTLSPFSYPPLAEAQRIAEIIRTKLFKNEDRLTHG